MFWLFERKTHFLYLQVKYETKMNQLSQRLAKALSELVDEKHLNESLRKNQTSLIEKMNSYDQRLTSRDSEIQELKVSVLKMSYK